MGYVRHNAIIATAWQPSAVRALVQFAEDVGAEAIEGDERTNGYRTVVITPDGSKEGWESSAEGDTARAKIREWLRRAGDSDLFFEWCEVAYGDDDGNAEIVDSEWVPTKESTNDR
jgi:hypothetical protein